MQVFLPDNAPFTEAQRAWLNGFVAGLLGAELAPATPGAPFPAPLLEGAKSVQLAEACYRSHRERRWVDLEPLHL